jgi:hypothetical protein
LTHARLQLHPRNFLRSNAFPPVDERGAREHVTSWLTARSPTIQASNKMKAAILGAVALVLPLHERKMFSGRHVFGGRCTLAGNGATTSFGNSHVPPLMHDIVLNLDDAVWLTRLHGKLVSTTNDDRRHCRALEYFYRAWPLDEPDRFPWLFMALDSIFGDSSGATQKVIDALDRHGTSGFPYERLKLLLSLRASVIHGGAPDVYDSEKYHRYCETYGEDPIHDIERVAARCFRAVIFDNTVVERPDDREAHRRAFMERRMRERGA